MVASYEKAQLVADPAVKKLLKRHPLNNTAMQFAMKYMKVAQYDPNHPQMLELLQALFGGYMSTVMIEQSAKVLRDGETRDNTNKTMKLMNIYDKLISSSLIDQHDRNDIQVVTALQPPPAFGERIFYPTTNEAKDNKRLKAGKLDLKGILSSQDWTSFQAQSQKSIYVEVQALLNLSQQDKWAEASELWHSRLLSAGSFVRMTGSDDRYLVLANYDEAALCWPLARIANTFFEIDLSVKKLKWVCIYGGDEARAPPRLGMVRIRGGGCFRTRGSWRRVVRSQEKGQCVASPMGQSFVVESYLCAPHNR